MRKTRVCRRCETTFPVVTRADANRQYCSRRCSRAQRLADIAKWKAANPKAWRAHNEARRAKDPRCNVKAKRSQRDVLIKMLGGKCLACGATNPVWLEVDYIPTTRGQPHRHPRGMKFIRDNIGDFRLLCANHHREVTLTGQIEGTDITQ